MDLFAQFGLAVQRLRRSRGMSQEDLADSSTIDRAYVGRLERGQGNPTLVTLARLASALHVPLFFLLKDVDVVSAKTVGTRPKITKGNKKSRARS